MENLDFQIEDKVTCLFAGKGKVINSIKDVQYPIKVRFETGVEETYSSDGYRYLGDYRRSLYHGHNLNVEITKEHLERYPWVNIYNEKYVFGIIGNLYTTKKEALNNIKREKYVTTIQLKPIDQKRKKMNRQKNRQAGY